MAQSEKAFEEKVKKWLKEHGAWYVKTWSNGVQRSGIPDLIICWKGRFIGLELKAEKGRASALQLYEIQKIREAGGMAEIVRPSDWDELKKILLSL